MLFRSSRRNNHSRKNKFSKSPVKATVVRVKHRSRGKEKKVTDTHKVSVTSKHSRGSRRSKLRHTDSYTKRPTHIVTLSEKLMNSDSSSDSQEDSDDSDFPDSTDPRDHEKEYRSFLKKQARIARRK